MSDITDWLKRRLSGQSAPGPRQERATAPAEDRAPADARQFPSGISGARGADGEGMPQSTSNFDWMDELHDDPARCLCRNWARRTDDEYGRGGHHARCRKGER